MAIVAVLGRKGGIGKSTIAGNLAAEFAAMGQSVIVLDADPQHSLADWAAQGKGLLSRCVEKVKHEGPEALQAKARKAQKAADLVMIDTPPGRAGDRLPGRAGGRPGPVAVRAVAPGPAGAEGGVEPGAQSPRGAALQETAHPASCRPGSR